MHLTWEINQVEIMYKILSRWSITKEKNHVYPLPQKISSRQLIQMHYLRDADPHTNGFGIDKKVTDWYQKFFLSN